MENSGVGQCPNAGGRRMKNKQNVPILIGYWKSVLFNVTYVPNGGSFDTKFICNWWIWFMINVGRTYFQLYNENNSEGNYTHKLFIRLNLITAQHWVHTALCWAGHSHRKHTDYTVIHTYRTIYQWYLSSSFLLCMHGPPPVVVTDIP